MTKLNPFVKYLKNIGNSINSLLEQNLNKLKFDNLKIVASNNKIIITVVALFITFISYILVPTFYKQNDISRVLKNELLGKLNLDFIFNQNLKYEFFPRPHFIVKDSAIIENQKNIAEINEIKIYISLNNLFSIENININEVILDNTNFELNNKNYNFFTEILDNNFLNINFRIKNSNIFFRNTKDEVLFINKIKKLEYYYDPNEFKNILYSENEIFNTPFSLEIINFKDENKLDTKLNLSQVGLKIENTHNYDTKIKSGSTILHHKKNKSFLNYKASNSFVEFKYFNDLDNKKFLYSGKLNFKPFYSSLEGNAEEINLYHLFGTNAIIAELLRTGIFNNKNIDFKINISANKIQNKRNFVNLFLKSKIQEGLIDIDNTQIEWKNNSIIKLTDTLILVKDGKLFLDGKSQINIKNVKNIYKFLVTPKAYRKQINIIDFRFSYAFGENVIILNDIIIDGKYNQKVNEKLINIYFHDSALKNKIYLKNMTNDLLKAYAG